MIPEIYSPGLEGIIAGETAISTITEGLSYRGYSVKELAEKCGFEEVAHLLLHGDLPNVEQLKAFRGRVFQAMTLPPLVEDYLSKVPANTVPMDIVRSAVSMLAHFEPQLADNSAAANLAKAERLLGQIPVIVARIGRRAGGQWLVDGGQSFAATFLQILKGTPPSEAEARAFDVSLILYAEHEFNASTFTARVVCSTLSDLHSSIVAAIGALKGPLHGGANEKVMDLLKAAGAAEQAETWIRSALVRKEKIMGFGHRVYKAGDVRAQILKDIARQAAERTGQQQWEKTAQILEDVLAKEKNLYPNLDWPAGRLYHSLGLDVSLYTPFFVMARVTGWSAHVIEQLANNRIIRPRSRYIGPGPRPVKRLEERG